MKKLRFLFPAILALPVFIESAFAVIVAGANGGGNTSNNSTQTELEAAIGGSFSYYSNMIRVSSASGTYLGRSGGFGWALTAKHVGNASTVIIDGVSYPVVSVTGISGVDIEVYKIGPVNGSLPDFPAVAYDANDITLDNENSSTAPTLIMAGWGRNRTEDATTDPGDHDATSTGDFTFGYHWTGPNQFRWGQNNVSGAPAFQSGQGGETLLDVSTIGSAGGGIQFFTDFDPPIDPSVSNWTSSNEAQGSTGDSGGSVWSKRNGYWALVGVLTNVFSIVGQDSNTSAFGNFTSAVHVRSYESNITAITGTLQGPPTSEISVVSLNGSPQEGLGNTGGFSVSRTGDTTSSLDVTIALSGSATNGSDYASLPVPVTIPAGASSIDVIVDPAEDMVVEGQETVILEVVKQPGYLLSSSSVSATETILDGAILSVVSANLAPVEGSGNTGGFTLSRTGDLSNALVVNYALSGTASSGGDYINPGSSIMIPAGQSSADVIVNPIFDLNVEGTESVILTIGADTAYAVSASQSSATETITDGSNQLVSLTSSGSQPAEGAGTGVFTFSRSGDLSNALTVNYTITGSATNGADYNTISTDISFAANDSTAELYVTPLVDTLIEGTEVVTLSVDASLQYATDGAANIASEEIFDGINVEVGVISLNQQPVEGAGTGGFTITRFGDTSSPLVVNFLLGGTAVNGADYGSLPNAVTIPAGASAVNVVVAPGVDTLVEGTETVELSLSADASYRITNGIATEQIIDGVNTEVSVVSLNAAPEEGSGNAGGFTLSRTGDTSTSLTIPLTISGTATNGTDYATIPTSVTIASGQSAVDVIVDPVSDTVVEGTETVVLSIDPQSNYRIVAGTATEQIVDGNNVELSIASLNGSPTEGDGTTGGFTITRAGDSSGDITVFYLVSGSAQNGVDYVPLGGSLVIPAGMISAVLTISPTVDTEVEGTETAHISLASNSAYHIDAANGTATESINDGVNVILTVVGSGSPIKEDDASSGSFTFTREGDVSSPLIVNFSLSGSAANGVDYANLPTSLVIPAGQQSFVLPLSPINDIEFEGAETVVIALASSADHILGSASVATETINDGANAEVSIISLGGSLLEDDVSEGGFRIMRTGDISGPLDVNLLIGGSATSGDDYTSLPSTVTVPGYESEVEIRFTALADEEVEGSEVVIASIASGAGYSIDSAQDNDLETIEESPYDQWLALHFSDPNAAKAAPADDLDGDGYGVLLEYALGGAPHVADACEMSPTISKEIDQNTGSVHAIYTFKYATNTPEITRMVEASSDLISWTLHDIVAGNEIELVSSVPETGGDRPLTVTTVRWKTPMGSTPRVFFRLDIEYHPLGD